MSSKSNKNRANKINPHGRLQQSTKCKTSKETYFSTGRVKQLSAARYYIGHTQSRKDETIIFVTVTRKHTNGNISFLIIGIHDLTGWIEKVQYDFNIPESDFNAFLATTNMVDFEAFESLEHLIYSAELKSRNMGNLPDDYWIARQILSTDKTTNLSQTYLRLASFQLIKDLQSIQSADDRYIKKYITKPTSFYDPATFRNWDHQNWEDYILNILPTQPILDNLLASLEMDLDPYYPLLYLYEQTELPNLSMDPEVSALIETLSHQNLDFQSSDTSDNHNNLKKVIAKDSNNPKNAPAVNTYINNLKNNNTTDPTALDTEGATSSFDYEANEEENFLRIGLETDLKLENTQAEHLKILKRIKKAIRNYPQNPYFRTLLYSSYRRANQSFTAEKVAYENYRAFPSSIHFINIALLEMIGQGKTNKLRRFFKSGYLLETHIEGAVEVAEKDFHIYYLMLAGYLAVNLKLAEFWGIYYFLRPLPGFNKDLNTILWTPYLMLVAITMAKKIKKEMRIDKADKTGEQGKTNLDHLPMIKARIELVVASANRGNNQSP